MKLKFTTKLSYGIGGIADNTMYTLAGTYLLLFMTTVAGVSPAVAGTISALGSIWEAMCAPVIGYKSDNAVTRYGRRKPFLMAGSVPAAIVTSLLFTAIDASPTFKIIYYAIMVLAFWTCFSSFFVPYMAWGSDLTDDYNERTVLRSFSYIFNQVGMCIGMVLPTIIVDYCMNLGKTTQQAWQTVGIIAGASAAAALLICTLTIKLDDKKDFVKPEKREHESIFKILPAMFVQYVDLLKIKSVRVIILASITYLIANITFSSDRVFYMTFNLGMDEKAISSVMLIITLAGVCSVPFITRMAVKFEKKQVFMFGIGASGVLMMVSRFVGVESYGALVAVCLFYAFANACYWQLMPSMLYDVCEVEELVSGKKRSGAVISLQALSESLSIAGGVQMLGIILELSGFNSEAAVQPELALTWVENAFCFIPGAAMLAVAVITSRYPVTKEVFIKVTDALARRKAGEKIDLDEFRDII
ncbi:MAG: MFS transporter [Firmicutes bacterium]|nr:MFS transporter [Bacillota bacterium]